MTEAASVRQVSNIVWRVDQVECIKQELFGRLADRIKLTDCHREQVTKVT